MPSKFIEPNAVLVPVEGAPLLNTSVIVVPLIDDAILPDTPVVHVVFGPGKAPPAAK